jgi:hypothetical protein
MRYKARFEIFKNSELRLEKIVVLQLASVEKSAGCIAGMRIEEFLTRLSPIINKTTYSPAIPYFPHSHLPL